MFEYKTFCVEIDQVDIALKQEAVDGWRLHTLSPLESLIHDGSSGDVYAPDQLVAVKFLMVFERINPEPEVEDAPQPMECKS